MSCVNIHCTHIFSVLKKTCQSINKDVKAKHSKYKS